MLILACRHLVVGGFAIWWPIMFSTPGFDWVRAALRFLGPEGALDVWGIAFGAIGMVALASALMKSPDLARKALFASVVVTFMWAGAMFFAIKPTEPWGYLGAVMWGALAAKDITMLRNPIRVPTEDEPDESFAPRPRGDVAP